MDTVGTVEMAQDTGCSAGTSPDSYENKRGAQRFSLLIRTAKLVGESGEFLCVVRDVSQSGVRLKLFHPLPLENHLALELANGDIYFIEKVWERDGHAGFQFSAPIDVHDFIEEASPYPRRPLRLRLSVPAVLTCDGVATAVQLRDLSQQGGRIECAQFLAVGQKIKLVADGLPVLIGNVCWRSSPEYGLVFQQGFAFDELARTVKQLQCGNSTADQMGLKISASPLMQ